MENRIKEQMCLFADRLYTDEVKGNHLRLYFSALAYTLVEALRRLALRGTEWAQAQVDTIRLKLFKISAIVRLSVRRIVLHMSSAYPWKTYLRRSLPRPALLTIVQPQENRTSTFAESLGMQNCAPNPYPTSPILSFAPRETPPHPTQPDETAGSAKTDSAPLPKSMPVRNAG
jgi:hypothetical protein